ncbi:hypothetical protein GGR28_003578 [Lewinella aquimaris]|uniref:Uncharacterized protein n=1 Tax=Neolewinella aquimaris TaxID=1835722 RepID=A0A840EGJ8_9BACT|nr:hypothetical protein [Neolewinella aquimaris]MBB4080939.1 hypothetical protein [Neolewinella aquimaris]
MFFQADNRFVAYRPTGEQITFRKAFSKIVFENSTIVIPHDDPEEESFVIPAAAIEGGVALGYRFLQDQLRKRQERFVHETHQRATNLEAGSYRVPKITYASFIYPENKKTEALRIHFEPVFIRGTGTFAYQLALINLNYSHAKPSDWSDVFDYTIQLTLNFLQGTELIEYPLQPVTVQSVSFTDNDLSEWNLYSSPIPLERNHCLIGASMTIVETNPAMVNTGKVLKLLTDNEQQVKQKLVTMLGQLLNPN